jgi:hypothetical protein
VGGCTIGGDQLGKVRVLRWRYRQTTGLFIYIWHMWIIRDEILPGFLHCFLLVIFMLVQRSQHLYDTTAMYDDASEAYFSNISNIEITLLEGSF